MEAVPRTIPATMKVSELADRIAAHDPEVCHHPALLVTDEHGDLAGIITRRDLLAAVERGEADRLIAVVMTDDPVCAYPDEPLHDALERMHASDVGRLPVVERANPRKLLGYLGRASVLSARRLRWRENHEPEPGWLSQT